MFLTYSKLKIVCFALMAGTLAGLVAILVVTVVNAKFLNTIEDKEPFTLDEFLKSTFAAKSWNGSWISGSTFLYKNDEGDVLKYDASRKKSETFLNSSILEDYPGSTIFVSKDEQLVLIRYNVSSVFRHSTTAIFTIYNTQTKQYHHIQNQKLIQLAIFSTVGHGIAYVFENNIYYLNNAEDVDNPTKITDIGISGKVYCGVPDWVYEEEVFGSGTAMWFSPSGQKLIYATFEDEQVKDLSYFIYGEPGSLTDQYPKEITIKYPKVGTPNPIVNVFTADLTTGEITKAELNVDQTEKDFILYDIVWITEDEFAAFTTNRVQNKSVLQKCNKAVCINDQIFVQENGWLEPKAPKFSKDGRSIEIQPEPEGDDKYNHIVLVSQEGAKRLTTGKKEVLDVFGWDEAKQIIYFSATVENTPYQQHVYKVSEEGEEECLTCNWQAPSKTCTYASASFSEDFSYMTKICSGPDPAFVQIENLSDPSDVIDWIDNAELRKELEAKSMPLIKYLEAPINDQFNARIKLLLPADFNEVSNKSYPAIVNVYAGPNSNQLSDAYSSGIQNYLVSNKEYIYIYIDGRGSGRDGQNKMFQVYRNLATVEIEDQIAITKYLQETFPFIDKDKTAIWGWSYGGFSTAWVMAKDKNNVFKCGLSVAPVTSFIYYDSIYTERYMGLPTEEDNLRGYNNTDVTRQVEAFRNKTYFLIHGNADDNVHYQQSMLMAKALENADILFRQQSYPDENHSLGHVSAHLYHTLDKYWAEDCFDPSNKKIYESNKIS